ncbi:hypothetical protein FNV43_RR16795 [Rhamnella rubrinervis]|uniref:Uncharacterized protein n=1 Tax=Rhamnella rubrinervis TaxID=2594499 RepID=A0A8K0GZE8_9ROSA|nr:hypothetical protein FNV43_RR16795 [Rhamnella rubrinervis]
MSSSRNRLSYCKPTDLLWASFSAVDMRKMKVRIPTNVELAEKERKKKEKVAQKAGQTSANKEPELTQGQGFVQQNLPFATHVRLFKRCFERDELHTEVSTWPLMKKVVYRKAVEDAFLQARKEMICWFKAGETNWPTFEPSKDEGDGEPNEISSGEDEPEEDAVGERNNDNLPRILL